MVQTQDKHLNKHLRYKRGINMKIELFHVINGYRKFHLGFYDDMHQAIKALKNHVYAYSAISEPRFRKSMSGNSIRIDYGAKTCYYLLEARKVY